MTTSGSSAFGMLRGRVSLRSTLVWLLLALLIAGAASYTSGSRYALVPGYGPVQAVGGQSGEGLLQAEATASSANNSASVPQAVHAVHEAGPFLGPDELEKDDERNKAPRGEPVPMRTGAVDPPSLTHREPGDVSLSTVVPPEPQLPALTVVDLSISRT